jgi:hypothetical protein
LNEKELYLGSDIATYFLVTLVTVTGQQILRKYCVFSGKTAETIVTTVTTLFFAILSPISVLSSILYYIFLL